MKTIVKATDYNNSVNWNLKLKGSNGLPYKTGYAVVSENGAIYHKNINDALLDKKSEDLVVDNSFSKYASYEDIELDWAVDHSATGLTHNIISKH